MNERLNQFLRFLEAEKPEFLPPQLDVMGLVRRLAITNPMTAAQELPQKLAQSQQMLENYTPGQPIDPRLLDQFMGLTGFGSAGITAYHGSPYLFRQFDPAKVGAGEGAQAYGVGAGYTAEARPVAESYKLAGNEGFKIQAANYAVQKHGNLDNAIKNIEKTIRDPSQANYVKENSKITLDGLLQLKAGNTGYLYKGDIPDEILPKFLDWDKPLSQQSKEVQDVIKKLGLTETASGSKEPTGAYIYEALARRLNPTDNSIKATSNVESANLATKKLEEMGIRGIRYLDRESRAGKKGTSNFIPFRPEDYKIEQINDIPIQQYIEQGLL